MLTIEDLPQIDIPRDLQAEEAVIGSALLDPDAFAVIEEILQGGEFYEPAHGRIFRVMRHLTESEIPIDLVSVTSRLQDTEELNKVGGVTYLSTLLNGVATTKNVDFYARRVADVYLRRQAIEMALSLVNDAASQQDVSDFLVKADKKMSKLSEQAVPATEFTPVKEVLVEVMDEAERLYIAKDNNQGITGIPSGFADLDKMTSGFQRNDLIIVAARPSVGKTAFALNVAQNVSIRVGETLAIFSLEMSKAQLVKRMICAEGMVDASRMRSGAFEGEDWEKMAQAVGQLSDAAMFIDDTPGITVHEIRAKCRRLKKEQGLGMILIDYLQLIQGRGRRGANRQEEVSEISRTLKQLARELEVPVIALSQLSRGVEQRQDKRPMMSDLRESGSIEQDADIVSFLYRDDYYDKESDKKNVIEIIIAKQRNGPVGTVELAFLKQFNKFVNLDRTHYSTTPQPEEPAEKSGSRIPDMHRGKGKA
ncbi:replicative DNA helicase [Paenibacillus daejeonensis]|uniref:replicative DNA helicase n=1 Tax=Paenibacillus daejeonensis TaxID=135193 RepID=UPI000382163D|nr:replicative DNA helicase [Paenibacillus daejeonensis]